MEAHCHRTGCICTHTEPCEYGWIWVEYYEEVTRRTSSGTKVTSQKREGVIPCPTCDPERAEIHRTSKNSRELQERLQARSKYNKKQAYEEMESSKTRTL
jgi:hypothetical protein